MIFEKPSKNELLATKLTPLKVSKDQLILLPWATILIKRISQIGFNFLYAFILWVEMHVTCTKRYKRLPVC